MPWTELECYVIDRYTELKDPDKWKQIQDAFSCVLEPFFNGKTLEQIENEREIFWVSQYQRLLPDEYPISAKDQYENNEKARKAKKGGQKPDKIAIDLALKALVDTENSDGTYTDAVKLAQDVINRECRKSSYLGTRRLEISDQTLHSWYKPLVDHKFCKLSKPGRGRQKK